MCDHLSVILNLFLSCLRMLVLCLLRRRPCLHDRVLDDFFLCFCESVYDWLYVFSLRSGFEVFVYFFILLFYDCIFHFPGDLLES